MLVFAHQGLAIGASLGWSTEVPPGSTGGSAIRADAVACPAVTQCTAVDTQGQEVTFNPQQTAMPQPTNIDWGNQLSSIACPAVSQCTAVDNRGGQFTFDPRFPTAIGAWEASSVSLHAVTCVSVSECVGVGNPQSTAVTFDPLGSPASTTLPIEKLDGLGAVSCPTASQCTATTLGNEITFDPAVAESPALVPIDSGGWIAGVACPSTTQCTAVEYEGRAINFNPTAPADAKASPIGIPAWDVACPSAEQCTAVGEFETSTFDPLDPEHLPLLGGAGGGFASAIACPTLTQCTVVAGDEETTFDPQLVPGPGHGPNRSSDPAESGEGNGSRGAANARSHIHSSSASTLRVSRDGTLFTVRCAGKASCVIEVSLTNGPPRQATAGAADIPLMLGRLRETIAAGKSRTVRIALTRAGARLLRSHRGRLAARLAINGTGGSALIHLSRSVLLKLG